MRHPAVAVLLLASPAAHTLAAPVPAPDTSAVDELDQITVTATLTERELGAVPLVISQIDRERLDATLANDLEDLVRYEPGVSVRSGFGRFGIGDVRIRGLDGDRVRLEIDGVPIADGFSIGSFSNAGRNYVDLDTLKQVEILRGPASSLYGSDALGGVVAFTSKDPRDYVEDGERRHVGVKLGYDGVDQSFRASTTIANAGTRWSSLVHVGARRGQEPGNSGSVGGEGTARTRPNPQETTGESLLFKLVNDVSADQRFRLTIDGSVDTAQTDVLTARTVSGSGATAVRVRSLFGDDETTRARIGLQHELTSLGWGIADALRWHVYRQDSETTQDTVELRSPPTSDAITRRERQFNFDERSTGAAITAHRDIVAGSVMHVLTYGIDVERSEVGQKRDGHATLANGTVTNVISPDTFPVRDFPLGTTTTTALYLQDEISLQGGDVQLIPGVRVDRYDLDPRADPLFASRNPGVDVTGITTTEVSPKLGAVWLFAPGLSVFGHYAHGFRAPPYDDVNIGFTNLQFGYTALPNPDLKPETSDGIELGVRAERDHGWLVASAYLNRYDDFIESLRSLGVDPVRNLIVFQSQNVAEAEIRGAEVSGHLALNAFGERFDAWSLRGALSWQRGEDRTTGAPLASVDPARAVLGLAWDGEGIGAELIGRFAHGKDRVPTIGSGATAGPAFAPAGYGVFDVLMHYDVAPGFRIDAGVFNLADRRYFDWSDVPLLAANTANIDRYSASGRTLSLNVRLDW